MYPSYIRSKIICWRVPLHRFIGRTGATRNFFPLSRVPIGRQTRCRLRECLSRRLRQLMRQAVCTSIVRSGCPLGTSHRHIVFTYFQRRQITPGVCKSTHVVSEASGKSLVPGVPGTWYIRNTNVYTSSRERRFHMKSFFLPVIRSTPSVRPHSSSQTDTSCHMGVRTNFVVMRPDLLHFFFR